MSTELRPINTVVSTNVSGYDGHLSAEVDNRPWGFNLGRSQYFEGDNCYVLVYKSDNVKIVSTVCSQSGVTFGVSNAGDKGMGENKIREGITFMSPISSVSKPMSKNFKLITQDFIECSGFKAIEGYTTVRVDKWNATGDPAKAPPYGYVFIEYEPKAELYAFFGLKLEDGMLSTTIYGVLFGKATSNVSNFIW